MSEREFLRVLDSMLDEKLDKKLDEKLGKLEERLEEKLERKLEEKLESKLEEKLDEKLEPINQRLKKVEMSLEYVVIPRLGTIEECYMTTSKRYLESAEGYETMKQDIEVLKKVVEGHSEKLQKIS